MTTADTHHHQVHANTNDPHIYNMAFYHDLTGLSEKKLTNRWVEKEAYQQ